MHINLHTLFTKRSLQLMGFGATCIVSSFLVGVQTVGEVHTVDLSEAHQANLLGEPVESGDVDGNGFVDVNDATVILEIVQGYRSVTPEILQADPNQDRQITVDDALRVLRSIALQ